MATLLGVALGDVGECRGDHSLEAPKGVTGCSEVGAACQKKNPLWLGGQTRIPPLPSWDVVRGD